MSVHVNPDAILLDIEGTTTSISFVYDALFPYARREMGAFLEAHFEEDAVQDALKTISAQAAVSPQAAEAAALALMDADVKQTGLKALQGMIWKTGYLSGDLQGHIYDDVPDALRKWGEAGIPVYIYSSGSISAQVLLFRHSLAGDLTPLLSGYFDTTTGPKKEPASYGKIAKAIGVDPAHICFYTDNLAEAEAAREAGVYALVSVRPGNPSLAPHDFTVVTSLA